MSNKKYHKFGFIVSLIIVGVFTTTQHTIMAPPITHDEPVKAPATASVPTSSSSAAQTPASADQRSSEQSHQSSTIVTETVQTPTITAQKPLILKEPIRVGDAEYPNLPYTALASTNDTVVDSAWERSISLPAARGLLSGSYSPMVAVIDTGVALQHEDLTANTWLTNSGESGVTTNQAASRLNCTDRARSLDKSCNNIDDNGDGIVDNESGTTSLENQSQRNCTDQGIAIDKSCNNIDDDGNGRTDDYLGYDFVNGDRSVLPGQTNPRGTGVSHGTLVSGLIAATNNNQKGIAGISSNARILPLQALDDDGTGHTSSVADAIYYAVARGVDVINLSLGGNTPDTYLKQAVDFANKKGIVVVAAAGNDGCGCSSYPAAYSSVISVGAVDNSGKRASFSNYADSVDITAPGSSIYSTAWSVTNPTTTYRTASGTSFSAPIIAASLAGLLSRYPAASPLQLKSLLYEQTSAAALPSGAIRDQYYGFGTINVLSSSQRATSPLTDAQIYSFYAINSGSKAGQAWARAEADKPLTIYGCNAGSHGGLTVYELTKAGASVFTASEVERDAAVAAGYSAQPQFNWCVLQDYDKPLVRSMNIYAELRNSYPKE